ncbi:kinase-like domain-containing protein [Mucor mucedo]|uniref:kinase-like domain-containing protein n=1 Tax=Mucor mucedo TaxID=29922 RepID=UPI00221FE86D|nr:kinase-like domain-containing protein [Mucor mucedo]KAI7870291.1 kinase-like domain-containing protein [Mucor mucedo]
MVEVILNGRFKKTSLLGKGSYGTIFKAFDFQTKQDVAIKQEKINSKVPQLRREKEFYEKIGNQHGFLRMISFFEESGFRYLVFTLVGKDLFDQAEIHGGKLGLKSIVLIAKQLVDRIEYLHDKGILHLDLKPENIAIGANENDRNTVYLLDFGLSKYYRNGKSHIPAAKKVPFKGTICFASVNAHKKLQQSRRDDIESLVYVIVYLMKGSLPWIDFKNNYKGSKHRQVLKEKEKLTSNQLCNGLEVEFAKILDYAKSLSFTQKPDYKFVQQLLDRILENNCFQDDEIFDCLVSK